MMSEAGFMIFWVVLIVAFGTATFLGLKRLGRYENEKSAADRLLAEQQRNQQNQQA